ncbi:MAG: type II secretion system F family protein, partial [Lentisphaeria bacterium]|nr:type II secretion system F family protein [Lentisphaeria bacterium]
MSAFQYNAITRTGRSVAGTIDAESVEEAGQLLLARGLTPVDLRPSRSLFQLPNFNRVRAALRGLKPRDLILFTKQFSTMLRAGMPVLRLLQVLEQQTESPRLRNVTHDILERVQRGESLHRSFAAHPAVFPPLYSNMINAGETSGALPEVLERLTIIMQHEDKVRNDVRAACRYPVIVVIMLVIAFFILLTFVIPKFAALFAKGGVALPLPTRICLGLYNIIANHWIFLLALASALFLGFTFAMRTAAGRLVRDRFLLRLPVLGPLFVKAAMSRFASIFAILQSSGVSALDALSILRD